LCANTATTPIVLVPRQSGGVLEQVLSPRVVHTTPEHAELKEIAAQCVTRHHAHHYLGFAATPWKRCGGTARHMRT
jgi:hypothetical protein